MTIGTLLQPFYQLSWGDITLHNVTASGQPENLIQNLTLSLNKEDSAPKLTFEITPTPIGFQTYQQLMSEALTEPIIATFGYMNGSKISNVFQFAGNKLVTGHNPKLQITGVSVIKGAWTDNKISYTMEKPISLYDLPELVKSKCGDGCKRILFKREGQAEESAKRVLWKGNEVGVTPHVIITRAMRESGIETKVGRSALLPGGTLVFSFAPGTEVDATVRSTSDQVVARSATPAVLIRNVFIIGSNLIEDFSRSQAFTTGSTSTAGAVSPTSPEVAQVNARGIPNPQGAGPQTDAVNSSNLAGGTSGQPNQGSQGSATTSDPVGLQRDARTAKAKLPTSTCSLTVRMVPYMTGIQPGDILAVPSLKGPGDYIEDWEVVSVSYEQSSTGGVDISLTGQRPFIGQDPILSDETIAKVRAIAQTLTTPDAWASMYWEGGK